MDTPRRDDAWPALSPDLSPSDYIFCWVLSAIQGASAWSSCPLSARANRCVLSFHGCLSRQTALDTSSSHPCTELHDLVTLHGSSTMFMPCSDVSSRPPCFENFRHGRSHVHNIPVLIGFFVPDVSTRPGSPCCKNWPNVTTRPPFFCGLKRRNNATPVCWLSR